MAKTTEVLRELEDLIIPKIQKMKSEGTSPEELTALAELVQAVSRLPRVITTEPTLNLASIVSTLNNLLQRIDVADQQELQLLEQKISLIQEIARIVNLLEI